MIVQASLTVKCDKPCQSCGCHLLDSRAQKHTPGWKYL